MEINVNQYRRDASRCEILFRKKKFIIAATVSPLTRTNRIRI